MTRRERREARAERLDQWAAKRTADAHATLTSQPELRHDWAFITQPGHIPERARMNARDDRAFQSLTKAEGMAERAAGIRQEMDRTIYSDDPDAIEQLEAKISKLEAKRDNAKAQNAAYRKEHAAELKTMGAYARSRAVPFPTYTLTGYGAEIRRCRERIETITRDKAALEAGVRTGGRVMASKYPGTCPDCGQPINRGDQITWYRSTREAVHVHCPTP